MLNYYYIIYTFIIISFIYGLLFLYKKRAQKKFKLLNAKSNKIQFNVNANNKIKNSKIEKVEKLKNKFNILSTEKTLKNNLINVIQMNNIFNFNNNNYKKKITSNILDNFNLDNKLTIPIIKSYMNTKEIYDNLFENINIGNLKDFHNFYSNKIINNNNLKCNIILKFFDEKNFLYIRMEENTLIKINNNIEYENLFNKLNKNNYFLINYNNEHYLSIGNFNYINFDNNDLLSTFFNEHNYIDNKNYKLLSNYKKVYIIYWISSNINY
jgi:hypothetical protein